MNLMQKDVKARVLNYFDRFDELIEENGLNAALDGNIKLNCKLLTDSLSPESLKEQVLLYQDIDPTVKTNVSRLFGVIKAEALKNQQSFDLYQSSRNKTSPRVGKASPRKNNGEQSNGKSQKGEATQSSSDDRPGFKKRNPEPAQGCLHCKGAHWVSDCPSASEKQKKTARQEFMNQRKVSKAFKMKRVLEDDEDLAPKNVAFNGGRVRMRQVTCIISETEEDEFLLGRLTLEALGIDVEGQFSALANKEIVDFDPFESETPVSFNPPDKGRIMGRLCELINEAITNGFPVDRKRDLFDVDMV
ncbi:hypothetical protein PInf_019008 [Phytophthora infestans]|nr:hypothetical protein PInf_019008 [Phytophthora infestans]